MTTSQRTPRALLFMPTPPIATAGPVATWVTVAGWAGALRRHLGDASVATPVGWLTAEETEALVAPSRIHSQRQAGLARRAWAAVRDRMPSEAHAARKDIRDAIRGVRFLKTAMANPQDVRLVWQHHELFQHAGWLLAKRAGAPLVQFVDAPIVWEAARWGVQRRWGHALERIGEVPQFRYADLIACVTEEVREAVINLGADRERTIVTPCGVDVDAFGGRGERAAIRRRFGMSDHALVIGWLGSFRRFHGLDLLLDAYGKVPRGREIHLLLVGDGLERSTLERQARAQGLQNVHFAGMVGRQEVPHYLCAMDCAVVTAHAQAEFHYSPLKVKEYMASRCAVVVPAIGEMKGLVRHDIDGLHTEPGSNPTLAAALCRLVTEEGLTARLGASARSRIEEVGTWDLQITRTLDALRSRGFNIQ